MIGPGRCCMGVPALFGTAFWSHPRPSHHPTSPTIPTNPYECNEPPCSPWRMSGPWDSEPVGSITVSIIITQHQSLMEPSRPFSHSLSTHSVPHHPRLTPARCQDSPRSRRGGPARRDQRTASINGYGMDGVGIRARWCDAMAWALRPYGFRMASTTVPWRETGGSDSYRTMCARSFWKRGYRRRAATRDKQKRQPWKRAPMGFWTRKATQLSHTLPRNPHAAVEVSQPVPPPSWPCSVCQPVCRFARKFPRARFASASASAFAIPIHSLLCECGNTRTMGIKRKIRLRSGPIGSQRWSHPSPFELHRLWQSDVSTILAVVGDQENCLQNTTNCTMTYPENPNR